MSRTPRLDVGLNQGVRTYGLSPTPISRIEPLTNRVTFHIRYSAFARDGLCYYQRNTLFTLADNFSSHSHGRTYPTRYYGGKLGYGQTIRLVGGTRSKTSIRVESRRLVLHSTARLDPYWSDQD